MKKIRHLIHEFHRRSLWQVLGIFLAASWGVLQVVELMTETVGLPDWTPSMAFVALLLGLPVVLATAFIQEGLPGSDHGKRAPPPAGDAQAAPGSAEGDLASHAPAAPAPAVNLAAGTGSLDRPSTRPSRSKRLFTWRNAILGGLGAFTLLGMSLVGYFVMWTMGIGPVGNLEAQGVFETGEPIVLADFGNRSNDPTLDQVVTEALRVDLAGSQALTLVPKAHVVDVLSLMQRDPNEPVTAEVAREVAVRDGVKAVVEGEVGSAGSGYIFLASITEAQTGSPIATFRRTADGPDDVIAAIDGLSQDIREKAGESLRSIKGEAPLDHVTTTSLEALRKYSEAERLTDEGEFERAKALLEEAVELDPNFAMGWRRLSVVLQSAPGGRWTMHETAQRAYDLRDRLTERERAIATAWYHDRVTGDVDAEMQAYEHVLVDYPDDDVALNNLAISYHDRTRYEESIDLLERATGGVGTSAPAYINLIAAYAYLGRVEQGWSAYEQMLDRYPARDAWPVWDRWYLQAVGGVWTASLESAEEMTHSDAGPTWRSTGAWMSGISQASIGHLDDALDVMDEARRLASRDERFWDAGRVSLKAAEVAWVAGSPDRARQLASAFLDSGDFERVDAPEREWGPTVEIFLALGMHDGAREVLDMWQRDMGSLAGSALRDASRAAEAAELSDPREVADALVQLREDMNCPRCFDWWLGELHEAAGDVDGAIARYESAMTTAHDDRMMFPLMRIVGHERLGRLHASKGDSRQAAANYATFADAWADADADLQPRVRAAREAAGADRGG